MKKHIIYLTLIALLISGFLTNIEAQRRFKYHQDQRIPNFLIEQLKLTDAQKERFEELRFNHQKEMIDLRADLQQKILELRKYKSSENLSRSKVISLTKEINEIRNKIALARANHQMDIYELLDETQRKIWHDNRPFGGNFMKRDKGMFRNWRNFCW